MTRIVSVEKPTAGQKVLAFGHHTYCCEEDMDEKPKWHIAAFDGKVSWDCGEDWGDGRLECVTHWHPLPSDPVTDEAYIQSFYSLLDCSDDVREKMKRQYPFLKDVI